MVSLSLKFLGKLRCEHRERNYRSNDERDNYGLAKGITEDGVLLGGS